MPHEQKYPCICSESPSISKNLKYHQGRGNHTVYGSGKETTKFGLKSSLQLLIPPKGKAPVREWKWSREEETNMPKKNGVPVPADLDNPYSVDQNLWGRANECGVLENPWNQAPEEDLESHLLSRRGTDSPEFIDIEFSCGVPISSNGEKMKVADLIQN